jgi:hypothetical protein
MRIPLVRGRLFDASDVGRSPLVAIVSEAMAARVWPGLDPIGRRLRTSLLADEADGPRWLMVAGIVGTARYREIENPRFDLYVPHRQSTIGVRHFMVHTDVDPLGALPTLRTQLASLDPALSIDEVTTMDDVVRRTRGPWQFNMLVFSLLGLMALTLAVIGLVGVVTYAVNQRTREIGIRMALGARRREVVTLMLWQGGTPVLIGVVFGVALAQVTMPLLSSLLFEVSPTDVLTLAAVAGLLIVVTLPAIYLPAKRAASVDPLVVMRGE